MDNEVYRDLSHDEVENAVAEWARETGARSRQQLKLPDGKVADVVIERPDGHIDIVECKDICTDSIVQSAYNKYNRWCAHLWIAVPRHYEFMTRPRRWSWSWEEAHHKVGFMLVTREGVSIIRDAEAHFMTESAVHHMWRYFRFQPAQGRAFEAE